MSVDAWLSELQRNMVEITMPLSTDEHDLACLSVDDASGSKGCVLSPVESGLAFKWKTEHPEHRLRKGDRLKAVGGQHVEDKAALLELNASALAPQVLTFVRSCPNEEQHAVLAH
eukprot:4372472-Karenia_brevis.AAC.1